jgi:hypothetical protein
MSGNQTPSGDAGGLWVPMLVEALACGLSGDDDDPPDAVRFMDLRPNYDECGDGKDVPALGFKLRRDLTDDPSARAALAPKGIHLHWRLPEAFLHIRPGEQTDASTFKPAPNRWAVIRLWRRGSVLESKSWIVESDFVSDPDEADDSDGAPWIVYQAADEARPEQPPYVYQPTKIGRASPMDGWQELRPASKSPLTAFAPANPAFAAFYPSCRNVFGFHDDATDRVGKELPDKTRCTYLVAGWFSNLEDDPLWKHRNAPALSWKAMQALQWDVPEALRWADLKAARQPPERTICYAFIGDVEWTAGKGPAAPSERPRQVGLGNGLIEAVAALHSQNRFSERVKSQLQFSSLLKRRVFRAELSSDDARRSLLDELGRFAVPRARLHEATFAAEPGGLFWEIVRAAESTDNRSDAPKSVVDMPATLSEALVALNRSQRSLDETERRLAILRRDLFAMWHNHAAWSVEPPDARLRDNESQLRQRIRAQATLVADCRRTLAGPEETVIRHRMEITRHLASEDIRKTLGRCDLVARQMPRFWRPNDPFLLVSGMRVPEVQGGATPLMCRVASQTLSLVDRHNGTGIQIARARLEQSPVVGTLMPGSIGAPTADVRALLIDVLFAHSVGAQLLAGLYARDIYGQDSAQYISRHTGQIEELQQGILAAARDIRSGALEGLDQIALECAERDAVLALLSFLSACGTRTSMDGNPFVPVFMVWKALWTKESLASLPWDLKPHEHDLSWRRDPVPGNDTPADYEGVAIVSRNLERGFKGAGADSQYQKFPEYKAVVDALSGLTGQSLAGLTDGMGLLNRGPQFPPPEIYEGLEDVEIRSAVGALFSTGPLRTVESSDRYFSPIRGGHLAITALSLVDTFGRVVSVIDQARDIRVTRTLRIGAEAVTRLMPELKDADFIGARLPPRLVQPARLLFRWMSANDGQECVADLRTSPICGWILPSRLDRGLLICSQDGELTGIIQSVRLSNGTELVRWSSLPPPRGGAMAEATESDIPNHHLRCFVNGLLRSMNDGAGGSTRFESLRQFLMNFEDRSEQPREQDLRSAMVGSPLALVRATLRLELYGPPWRSHTKEQLLTAGPDQLRTPEVFQVSFPVRLGDRQLGPDGLVGYFIDGEQPSDYEKMRLSGDQTASPLAGTQPYFDKTPYLMLECRPPDGAPVNLTLLMDPRAGVHIVSGILPSNVAVLPPAVVSVASAALRPRFLVAPVLAEWSPDAHRAASPGIPLPTNGKDEWGWYAVGAGGEAAAKPAALDPASKSIPFGRSALYEGWLGSMAEKGKTT